VRFCKWADGAGWLQREAGGAFRGGGAGLVAGAPAPVVASGARPSAALELERFARSSDARASEALARSGEALIQHEYGGPARVSKGVEDVLALPDAGDWYGEREGCQEQVLGWDRSLCRAPQRPEPEPRPPRCVGGAAA